MDELIARLAGNLHDRVGGPMWFRLVLQPAMAMFLAVRAGRQDGLTGVLLLLGHPHLPTHRRDSLREGWKAVASARDGRSSTPSIRSFTFGGSIPWKRSSWPSSWPSCPIS